MEVKTCVSMATSFLMKKSLPINYWKAFLSAKLNYFAFFLANLTKSANAAGSLIANSDNILRLT